jgi:hypothetical protein
MLLAGEEKRKIKCATPYLLLKHAERLLARQASSAGLLSRRWQCTEASRNRTIEGDRSPPTTLSIFLSIPGNFVIAWANAIMIEELVFEPGEAPPVTSYAASKLQIAESES